MPEKPDVHTTVERGDRMTPLIITAALTGAELTRHQHPRLPITPEEIGIAAAACAEAGASVVHVHAREADGTPTQRAEVYAQIIDAVQQRCDVIVQVSTGGAVGMSPEERLAPVYLRPEMATLSMGSVNFGREVFLNLPDDIEHFAAEMARLGVEPELEVFDAGMLSTARRCIATGVLQTPLHVGLVLGVKGGMPGTPQALQYLVSELPSDATWSVAGIGAAQLPLSTLAIVMGGHVRVGLEDNLFYRKGELARDNAQLVARVARIARELERAVAGPAEARSALGLAPRITPP